MMKKYYFKNEQTLKAKEGRNTFETEIRKADFFEMVGILEIAWLWQWLVFKVAR